MSTQLSVDVKTNIEKELPQIIEFNFEPLKAELAKTLEKYKGLVVTQDAVKDAKDTRASLNRFKKSLNDTRITIGKEWSRPYDAFKARIDELIAMVDEPTAAIDSQIKAFEESEREEKREAITLFYGKNVKELLDILPLARVWDDKWLNKTVALGAATEQLSERMDAVRKDLKTIDTMEIEYKDYLRSAYLRTLNIGAALDERRVYENEQKALKKRETEQAQEIASPPPAAPTAQFPPEIDTPPVPLPETRRDLELRFFGTTKAFRQELKALAQRYGVKYEGGIISEQLARTAER